MAVGTGAQNGYSTNRGDGYMQSSSRVADTLPPSDHLIAASDEAAQNGPFTLALRDCITFVRMLPLFPTVFLPFATNNPEDEFYLWNSNIFGLIALTLASVLPILLVLLAIPAFVVLPGSLCVLITFAGIVLVRLILKPVEGPSLVTSAPPTDEATIARHRRLSSERWIFLNGCCVTGHALQQNLNLLSETFGRPIQGVHNETWGIVGDIFECIVQRAFNFHFQETRIAYEYVKAYCSDPKITKVVLIGHSQGGIIVSQILDGLFMDLPCELVEKLEVYTFGNAASHFNNPLRKPVASQDTSSSILTPSNTKSSVLDDSEVSAAASPTAMISPTTPLLLSQKVTNRSSTVSPLLPQRIIPHIEHYCNSQDMVTRWGALYSAKNLLGNRFCGHVFINADASGHMLNQHYLANMFPKNPPAPGDPRSEVPFLDRIVAVDSATVVKSDTDVATTVKVSRHNGLPRDASYNLESISARKMRLLSYNSNSIAALKLRMVQNTGLGGLMLGDGIGLKQQDLAGAEGSRITVAGSRHATTAELRGAKKVRELSRLWRYMGGESPSD